MLAYAMGQAPASAGVGQSGGLMSFLPLIVLICIVYFGIKLFLRITGRGRKNGRIKKFKDR